MQEMVKPVAQAEKLRRYKTASAAKGRGGKERKGTTLNAKVRVELMQQLLALAEEWANAVGATLDKKATAATRERIETARPATGRSIVPGIPLGVHMAVALASEIVGTEAKGFKDGLVFKQQRKKGSILKSCLEEGIEAITVPVLIRAYPDTQPSLNLVALLAFNVGLQKFKGKFAGGASGDAAQSVAKQTAAAQRLAERWTKEKRRWIVKQLNRKAKKETISARQEYLANIAALVQTESPEYLEKMEALLQAEIE